MDVAHVCVRAVSPLVCVRGGTTSSVVPLQTQMGGWMAWVWMWAVPIGARVRVHYFLCCSSVNTTLTSGTW